MQQQVGVGEEVEARSFSAMVAGNARHASLWRLQKISSRAQPRDKALASAVEIFAKRSADDEDRVRFHQRARGSSLDADAARRIGAGDVLRHHLVHLAKWARSVR